jgi:hypothetical protein
LRCVRVPRTRHAGTKKAYPSLRGSGSKANSRFLGLHELDAQVVVGALDMLDRGPGIVVVVVGVGDEDLLNAVGRQR